MEYIPSSYTHKHTNTHTIMNKISYAVPTVYGAPCFVWDYISRDPFSDKQHVWMWPQRARNNIYVRDNVQMNNKHITPDFKTSLTWHWKLWMGCNTSPGHWGKNEFIYMYSSFLQIELVRSIAPENRTLHSVLKGFGKRWNAFEWPSISRKIGQRHIGNVYRIPGASVDKFTFFWLCHF